METGTYTHPVQYLQDISPFAGKVSWKMVLFDNHWLRNQKVLALFIDVWKQLGE